MESELLTRVEGKVVNQALPGNKGNFLDGRRGTAEAELLQMQQGVDEGTSSVEQL